uniref:plexin-D1 isoform X2 n=1 Tax=Myxine glutinosa TaxID=7769 RepID=UPI00358FF6A5
MAGKKMSLQVLLISFILSWTPSSISLYLSASRVLETPSRLLSVGGPNGSVYVGCVNQVYQLSAMLDLQEVLDIGPKNDSTLCHAPSVTETCTTSLSLMDNVVKLLMVEPSQGVLLVCGSLHQGSCTFRSLHNISKIMSLSSYKPNTKSAYVAANDARPNASTVAARVNVVDGHPALIVASTFTGLGSGFWNRQIQDLRYENNPELSLRALNFDQPEQLLNYGEAEEGCAMRISTDRKESHQLEFLAIFVDDERRFTYLVFNNRSGEPKENEMRTALARVCLRGQCADTKGGILKGSNLGQSYAQLGLSCKNSNNSYILSASFSASERQLYAVFQSSPDGASALCWFSLSEVDERISAARRGCFQKKQKDLRLLQISPSDKQQELCAGSPSGSKLSKEQAQCGAQHLQSPVVLLKVLFGVLVEGDDIGDVTAVATTSVYNRTVLLMGTEDGKLIKRVEEKDGKDLSERLELDLGSSVLPRMVFDPEDDSIIFVLTTEQVSRVSIASCDQHTSCSACLSSGDPYCTWCTLSHRCVLERECLSGKEQGALVTVMDGADQCPVLHVNPTSLNLDNLVQSLELTFSGKLPHMKELHMQCRMMGKTAQVDFRSGHGNASCSPVSTWPTKQKPSLEQLFVQVEIDGIFVTVLTANITLYRCSVFTTKMSEPPCTTCLDNRWDCHWCVQTHDCVPSTSACASAHTLSKNEHAHCPRVVGLASGNTTPSGQDLVIDLHVENLFQTKVPSRTFPFSCKIGEAYTGEALKLNETAVRCSASNIRTHLMSEHLSLDLVLRDNNAKFVDNADHVSVMLYNCEVGSLDCSHCESRQRMGQNCTWCAPEGLCKWKQNCTASPAPCPSPTITKISPQVGPVEGGTLVTVEGLNLGKEFSEVENLVTIGGVPCVLRESDYKPSHRIVCVTGKSENAMSTKLKVVIEGKHVVTPFDYVNPKVTALDPKEGIKAGGTEITIAGEHLDAGSSLNVRIDQDNSCEVTSGGRNITIHGVGFTLVQRACMRSDRSQMYNCGKECQIKSDTTVFCPSPALSPEAPLTSKVLLILDGHVTAKSFRYSRDPVFEMHSKSLFHKGRKDAVQLSIEACYGDLNLGLKEISIHAGQIPCEGSEVKKEGNGKHRIICFVNVPANFNESSLPVWVRVGNLEMHLGAIPSDELPAFAIPLIVLAVLVVLLGALVFGVLFYIKNKRAKHHVQKVLMQMEDMESQMRDEIRKGFAELQTDMTDLTSELKGTQGIPFLSYEQFTFRTLFPEKVEQLQTLSPHHKRRRTHTKNTTIDDPLLNKNWQPRFPDACGPGIEDGLAQFMNLLNNKHFLVTFIHTLEQQKDFSVKDRCYLASWLTANMQGKLEYLTSILKDLLVDLVESSTNKHPKLMLRRTESVVEKMLTNWMSLCMYAFLRDSVGETFFLLLRAIKQQISKGPVDAVTGKAKYTLSEDWLLRENVEAMAMNVNVSFQGSGMDSQSIRILECDSISQVKEKALDTFYRNVHRSQCLSPSSLDIDWIMENGKSKILKDLDNTSKSEGGKKKINTIQHYGIQENASLALSRKDAKVDAGLYPNEYDDQIDVDNTFHMVPSAEEMPEKSKSKVLPEVYLTRLLSTKGTLHKFVHDLFHAILTYPHERPPLAVKYIFDFLEEQAKRRGVSDAETIHIWKTNSLLLRFWVNILKNPQFVFDIEKTPHMDACLSVLAQALIDACSTSCLTLSKDSPTNKLLFAREIPEFKKLVQDYYEEVQQLPPLSEQEVNSYMAEDSLRYGEVFNTKYAASEIYKYLVRYRHQVLEAMELNQTARRMQLPNKLSAVLSQIEGPIYENCSEV